MRVSLLLYLSPTPVVSQWRHGMIGTAHAVTERGAVLTVAPIDV